MNQSISFSGLGSSIGKFLGRYHMILFFIIVSAGLGYALISVITIISTKDSTGQAISPIVTTFDEATIKRLDSLNTASTDTNQLTIPTNTRINPLVDN